MREKLMKYIKEYLPLLIAGVIILVSCALRCPQMMVERLWPDEALFSYIAREIFRNPLFIFSPLSFADHLPLFPFLVSLGKYVASDLVGFRVVTVFINLVGLWLLYRIGTRVGGRLVGLFSMVFLATNVFYYQQAGLIHSDGLFALVYAYFGFVLLDSKSLRWAIILSALAAAACKWYGAFWVIPVLFCYYLFTFPHLTLINRMKEFCRTAMWVVLPLLPYGIFKIFYIHGEGGIATFNPLPCWTYAREIIFLVGGKWHLCLLLLGVLGLWRYSLRTKVILYAMGGWGFFLMSCVPEKDSRYLLPLFMFWSVITAVGINEGVGFIFRGKLFKPALIAVSIISAVLMGIIFGIRKDRAHLEQVYTGFIEAGGIVKELDDGKVSIWAGSPRQIAFASEIIPFLRVRHIPRSQEDFLKYVHDNSEPLILVVDAWNWREEPDWVYPMAIEKEAMLKAQGFRVEGVVRKLVQGQMKEVVYVFFRPAR